MSIDWFRSWHGAPTDPKWLLVARNAMKRSETHVTPGMVSAVVWALFDHASQAEQRGNVEGFDVETYAVFSGFSEVDITAIIDEMKEKKLIISGCLSAWEKRQPKREDNSTGRVREHRNAVKRNVTQGNAREEKSREEKSREEKKEREGAIAPLAEKIGRKKPRLPMPDIFLLTDKLRGYATERGFVGVRADQLFAAFKNHHGANGSIFANWDLAWNKWVDNEIKFSSQRQVPGRIPRL